MRHKKYKNQLNRFTSFRVSTLRSMARALLTRQRVRTTRAKAKAVRSLIDRLISYSKDNTLASRRKAFRILQNHQLVQKLFVEIGPRFKARNGGYTRIINLKLRRGDNANLVILELTEQKLKEEHEKIKKEKEKGKETPLPTQGKTEVEITQEEKGVFKKGPFKTKETKPPKKFLGGLRRFFKKERDSL